MARTERIEGVTLHRLEDWRVHGFPLRLRELPSGEYILHICSAELLERLESLGFDRYPLFSSIGEAREAIECLVGEWPRLQLVWPRYRIEDLPDMWLLRSRSGDGWSIVRQEFASGASIWPTRRAACRWFRDSLAVTGRG